MVNSSLGPVYRKCPDTKRFSTAETLSSICRNVNNKHPKTVSAKIAIGKLLGIVNTQESAMLDLSRMSKDLVKSLVNSKKVMSEMSMVRLLIFKNVFKVRFLTTIELIPPLLANIIIL